MIYNAASTRPCFPSNKINENESQDIILLNICSNHFKKNHLFSQGKSMMRIPSFADASVKELSSIRAVFFDIDDTITSHGKLTSASYRALWDLKACGYLLVPITGRPAAWCDHIVRFWPVDAIVGENGAFVFFMAYGKRSRIDYNDEGQEVISRRLNALKKEIEKKFPEALFASDQRYREYDLAIDLCEDVPPWPMDRMVELKKFVEEKGFKAKLSSIHLNVWYGEHEKAKGIELWLNSGMPGVGGKRLEQEEMIFIGDSPNDAPLFAYFENSVAVANIKKYLPDLPAFPSWITAKESGEGFCQFADKMIKIKQEK